MKTMYEINWHYRDKEQNVFSHCTVTPITVLRESILPGCMAVSITAKDSQGRTFQGSQRDYYASEAEAWAAAKQDLLDTVENNDAEIKKLKDETDRIFKFLITIPETTGALTR